MWAEGMLKETIIDWLLIQTSDVLHKTQKPNKTKQQKKLQKSNLNICKSSESVKNIEKLLRIYNNMFFKRF